MTNTRIAVSLFGYTILGAGMLLAFSSAMYLALAGILNTLGHFVVGFEVTGTQPAIYQGGAAVVVSLIIMIVGATIEKAAWL